MDSSLELFRYRNSSKLLLRAMMKMQQEKLLKRMDQIDKKELKAVGKESMEILARLRAGMEAGLPPDSPEIVPLAKCLAEAQAMVDVNDPEIEQAI